MMCPCMQTRGFQIEGFAISNVGLKQMTLPEGEPCCSWVVVRQQCKGCPVISDTAANANANSDAP